MRVVEKLRRPDWLGELQSLLLAALVLMGVAVVMLGVGWARDGLTVRLPLSGSEVSATLDPGLEDDEVAGAEIVAEQPVEVKVVDPSAGQQALYVLTRLPVFVVIASVLALMWWTVRDARRSDPFTLATVRRLRALAAVVLVGGVGAGLAQTVAAFALAGTVGRPETVWVLPVPWLLGGFVLLAVAEVVRRGCAMRDELATVV